MGSRAVLTHVRFFFFHFLGLLFFFLLAFRFNESDALAAAESPKDHIIPHPRMPWWLDLIDYLIIGILVFLSGAASGLTLGLLSLDKIGLEIVIHGDDAQAADCAKRIQPVRENGNLLLCTLLFVNVALNAALSILTAHITSNLIGFLVSTFLILVFAEVIPMSVCGRHALKIGSKAVPIVKILMFLVWPLCKPFAFALDYFLGEEIGTIHSRQELMKLLEIHVQHGSLDAESGAMVGGALKYKSMCVQQIMTPIEKMFALSENEILHFKTVAKIFKSGFSRIPVYGENVDDIKYVLFVKDLIFLDLQDEIPLKKFIAGFGRSVLVVWTNTPLDEALTLFKKGQGHLAIVKTHSNDTGILHTVGIVTLEDIIENIIGDEIRDETDEPVEKNDVHARQLALDFHKIQFSEALVEVLMPSSDEAKAITAFLMSKLNEPPKMGLTHEQFMCLIKNSPILTIKGAEHQPNELIKATLYRKNVSTTSLTLVLDGTITILDGTESEVGAWSILAADALLENDGEYAPHFTAFVSSTQARCLLISRSMYQEVKKPKEMRTGLTRGKSTKLWIAEKRDVGINIISEQDVKNVSETTSNPLVQAASIKMS